MLNYDNKTRCPACFTELEAGVKICLHCGFSEEDQGERLPVALPLGTVLMGRYVIGNVLGKGGFGITYLAYDLRDNKTVAIKEYLPDTLIHRNTGDTTVSTFKGEKGDNFNLGAEKFYEEAKTVSKFNGHPNVINVYEFFYENNTAYFVMEYIKGVDLKKYIVQHGGRLSEEETIKLLMPILDALIVVHSVGVLHRDISPDNIFVGEDGNVKLLDFGSARQVLGQQSKSLSVILKPGFAPLEQYQSRGKQGPWTDIYSLTATMYYCITGTVPDDCMNRVEDDSLILPSAMGVTVSKQLEAVLLKGMAVRAADRYQSVFQLKGDMERLPGQAEAVLYEAKPTEHAADPISESVSTGMETTNLQTIAGQTEGKAALISSEAEKRKPELKNNLKIIIGVMAACIIIFGTIATAAILRNNSSKESGGSNGSSGAATLNNNKTTVPGVVVRDDQNNTPASTTAEDGIVIAEEQVDASNTPAAADTAAKPEEAEVPVTDPAEAMTATIPTPTLAPAPIKTPKYLAQDSSSSSDSSVASSPAATPTPTIPPWTDAKANTLGNTPINISLNAYVAEQDGWIYYSTDTAIYCMKANGKNATMIADIRGFNLNVIGNYLYFIDTWSLYRLDLTTLKYEKISKQYITNMWMTQNKIYYYVESDGIYQMNLDGSNSQLISHTYSIAYSAITVSDGYVYDVYKDIFGNKSSIRKINIDTGITKEIYTVKYNDITDITIHNNKLYFFETDVSSGWPKYYMWTSDLDGGSLTKITSYSSENAGFFWSDTMYKGYFIATDVEDFILISMDRSESDYRIKRPSSSPFAGVIGDYLYLRDRTGFGMCRVHLKTGESEQLFY